MTKVRYFLMGAAVAVVGALAVPVAAQIASAITNNVTACLGCASNSIVVTAPGGANPILSAPASASTLTGTGLAGFMSATSAAEMQMNLGGL
jgi:hypothetical protein